jgi:hypothetical protein
MDNMKKKIISFAASITALIIVFSISAGEPSLTRVQVICPAMPVTDAYTPVAFVARDESWEIDREFTGEAWLWTDGPWIRPFKVEFKADDRGVVYTPVRFNLPVLQRVESYSLTGTIHTWSNPVKAVKEDYTGPRLLWGMLEDCSEPLLDFCIRHGVRNQPPPHTVLSSSRKEAGKEVWHFLIDPALDNKIRSSLETQIAAANSLEDLIDVISSNGSRVLLIREISGSDEGMTVLGLELPFFKDEVAEVSVPHLAAIGPPGKRASESIAHVNTDKVTAIVSGKGGFIGVWSDGAGPEAIWRALKAGDAYASWGSRIIVDWMGVVNGNKDKNIFIAGEGPREEVTVIRAVDGEVRPIATRASDDYHLQAPRRGEAGAKSGRCLVEVIEPGSPRAGRAMAGPF